VTYTWKAVSSHQLPMWLAVDSWHLASAADLQPALHSYAYSHGRTAVLWPTHMMLGCWAGDDHYSFTTQTSHALMIPRVPVVTLSRPCSPVLYRSPCLGLCRSVERLSASNVNIDKGCSLRSIHSYGVKPFLSFKCNYCTFDYGVCLRSWRASVSTW